MKYFFRYILRSLPLTVGIILSIIALCFLVQFYDRGLDFEAEEFWAFSIFFIIGFPLLVWGIDYLSRITPNNQSKTDA